MRGWNRPSRTKKIIRSDRKVPRPDGPNRFWESDMSYVWCGIDGRRCRFDVADVFTRRRPAFVVAEGAARHEAVMALDNAAAAARPDTKRPTVGADNGSRYTSRDLRSSMAVLGITPEYICVNTPGQNGHIESLHKTLKKEHLAA